MEIPLPIREFKSGEEHFPINFYFDDNFTYEVAVAEVCHKRTSSSVHTITTNILEYDIFNPDQILLRFGPISRITTPIFYKVGVASLKNLRIRLDHPTETAITLIFRRINGDEKI